MNIITITHVNLRVAMLLSVALTILVSSCRKSDFQASQGECEVSIGLESFSFETDDTKNKNAAKATQRKSLMIEGQQVIAELVPVPTASPLAQRTAPMKAAVTEKMKAGVKYRVIVYDKNGNYKDTKIYTVGSEHTEGAFLLDGGVEYQFIAVSYGNNNVPNAPLSTVKLAAAELNAISLTPTFNNAVLYANVSFTPKSGSNKLNLVLKNLISEVNLRFDASSVGIIQAATASLSGIYTSIQTLKLINGSITPGVSAQSRSFLFPVLQQSVVSASPGIMYTGNSPAVNFKSTVTIGGLEKTITLNGFQVVPGYKYNLNITFLPSGVVIGNRIWAKGNLSYANGIYVNRSSPEQTGYDYRATDYWNYGSPELPLLPAMNTTFQAETPTIIFPINDPCTLISGGQWRMPTLADFAALGPPTVVDANGTVNGILNGLQPNGVGSSATGTREVAGYIYFQGVDEVSGDPLKLKFFAGGGLKGGVINNIPAYEPDISTFRNFDVVYHAIDSQEPSTGTGLHGVPNDLKGYVYAPPTFITLNENTDKRFNFLSHRFVHTASENSVIWPRRDSRFPIRCVKDK